ncbi:hypothetical protein CONPUDRAFT_139625 [Coniophora puteana RWD-64-598 SS2]|uniref:Uncharacterized protein n=1 Tax=Coniophora puteana (strain RWD-64-598) TaxID=741705 RepID=A0A5M3MC19_CONPW|nr:uncharacterized protein CONPUDRAFT_139625 [Coniophora puteana RWD-64-598 SS2]EIW76185.1 hypothetical protein CONPUDRAFT_139625 [Coniophora puteana RWD-64-598 SS2]
MPPATRSSAPSSPTSTRSHTSHGPLSAASSYNSHSSSSSASSHSSASTATPSKRGHGSASHGSASASLSHGGLPTPRSTPGRGSTPRHSPRRVPHCVKCGRPRAGHPRSGCPYAGAGGGRRGVNAGGGDGGGGDNEMADGVSTVNGDGDGDDDDDDGDTEMGMADGEQRGGHECDRRMVDATASLQSLQIVVPGKEEAMEPLSEGDEEDYNGGCKRKGGMGRKSSKKRDKGRLCVRFAVADEGDLASLSSGAMQIVNRLLQPGIMASHRYGHDEEDDGGDEEGYFPVSPDLTPTPTQQTQPTESQEYYSQWQASSLGKQDSFILRWQSSLVQANPEPPTTMEMEIEEEEDIKPVLLDSLAEEGVPPPTQPAAPVPVVKLSRRMPGTLYTPTSSIQSAEDTKAGLQRDRERCWNDNAFSNPTAPAPPVFNRPAPSTPPPAPRKARPIMRTMSAEERSSFIRDLNARSKTATGSPNGGGGEGLAGNMPPAMLFRINAADVAKVKGDAHKHGFFVEAFAGEEKGQAWLVLGRDREAVAVLGERFSEESKKEEEQERAQKTASKGSRLGAYARGAVVGAVATWTGLAFS